jgi:hypothetical protein
MADLCRVELHDIDAGSPAEGDGRDELRFLVDGNLFPRFDAKFFGMRAGDDGDPADFENPTAFITNTQNVTFDLREADGPIYGQGVSLGRVVALGATCDGLATGGTTIISETLTGDEPTDYQYVVRLRMTGL